MNSQNKMVYMQKILNPSQYRSSGLRTLNKENFARIMIESINKAMSSEEAPVKAKHVRKLLIGSHQAQSGSFFWEYLPTIRLKENQIVCWKFCNVLHKMLREGHQQFLVSARERRQILLDCGNMWRHVPDGYGPFIHKYCTLIFNRINFLTRNPNFPNDLKLDDQQLDAIGDGDPGIFFDLSCEIFDALDDILSLQKAVLSAITLKLSSVTSEGQCRLSPLVICIQDSTLLYDYSVKILFKLHASLPESTLEGHRGRFLKQHEALRKFYIDTSNLQYFRTLIQIPQLSMRPPNFLIASDLQQHVTPKVVLVAESLFDQFTPDQVLVDLEDSSSVSANDDSTSHVSSDTLRESSSSFDPMGELPPEPTITSNSSGGRENLMDSFLTESLKTLPKQIEESNIRPPPEIEEEPKPDPRDERILELERIKDNMTREFIEESEDHDKTKRELSEFRQQVSKLTHQLVAAKKAYDKLQNECERAKHDNEISQIAMRKLAKEMSELRGKRNQENQQQEQQQHQQHLKKLEEAEEMSRRRRMMDMEEANKREEDLLVAEMNEIDKIIREATKKIEELSEKSRKIETGIKLQVNEKISEVCTNLMKAVRNLIAQSRILQREIVGQDGKTNSEEFYKRNSSWTDGLISAANEVAMAAKSLVDSADRSMSGPSVRFSELAAAAHQVATATTQLVVASRVKANKDSEKLKNLTNAAKQVNQCTSNVVEASKVCAQLIEEDTDKNLDISSLSLHQTKKLEMESQVRLLELEEQLSKERVRLGVLRRRHYEQEEAQEADVKPEP